MAVPEAWIIGLVVLSVVLLILVIIFIVWLVRVMQARKELKLSKNAFQITTEPAQLDFEMLEFLSTRAARPTATNLYRNSQVGYDIYLPSPQSSPKHSAVDLTARKTESEVGKAPSRKQGVVDLALSRQQSVDYNPSRRQSTVDYNPSRRQSTVDYNPSRRQSVDYNPSRRQSTVDFSQRDLILLNAMKNKELNGGTRLPLNYNFGGHNKVGFHNYNIPYPKDVFASHVIEAAEECAIPRAHPISEL